MEVKRLCGSYLDVLQAFSIDLNKTVTEALQYEVCIMALHSFFCNQVMWYIRKWGIAFKMFIAHRACFYYNSIL